MKFFIAFLDFHITYSIIIKNYITPLVLCCCTLYFPFQNSPLFFFFAAGFFLHFCAALFTSLHKVKVYTFVHFLAFIRCCEPSFISSRVQYIFFSHCSALNFFIPVCKKIRSQHFRKLYCIRYICNKDE